MVSSFAMVARRLWSLCRSFWKAVLQPYCSSSNWKSSRRQHVTLLSNLPYCWTSPTADSYSMTAEQHCGSPRYHRLYAHVYVSNNTETFDFLGTLVYINSPLNLVLFSCSVSATRTAIKIPFISYHVVVYVDKFLQSDFPKHSLAKSRF